MKEWCTPVHSRIDIYRLHTYKNNSTQKHLLHLSHTEHGPIVNYYCSSHMLNERLFYNALVGSQEIRRRGGITDSQTTGCFCQEQVEDWKPLLASHIPHHVV
jgi:hypothetical protein